jgi:hypothetical protein
MLLGIRALSPTDLLQLVEARLDKLTLPGTIDDATCWSWLASALVCAERVATAANDTYRAMLRCSFVRDGGGNCVVGVRRRRRLHFSWCAVGRATSWQAAG